MLKLVMVGGPFSGNTVDEIERNIVATERLGLDVVRVGGACVVPNSMGRAVLAAKINPGHYAAAPDYDAWMGVTKAILSRCDALIVTPDWKRSNGTRAEVDEAIRLGVQVFFDTASLQAWLASFTVGGEMSTEADALEQRVNAALKAAYREGPEWMEVRAAVEALKADRRRIMASSLDGFVETLGREAERTAEALEEEAARFSEATKGFVGDMKSAFDRFRKKT